MSSTAYHLVGVGGAGMSALARILLARGDAVSGSDARDSAVLDDLRARGASVFVGHRAENLNGACCVVVSAAIPPNNPEVHRARERSIPIVSRAELLGRIMDVPRSVAVTGTHGKSTTSAMLASILMRAGLDPTVLLGADLPEMGGNARCGRPDLVVAEVCEAYDSFLKIRPACAVLTNVEPDHLDYYRTFERLLDSFRQFVRQVDPGGVLIGWGDDPQVRALMALYEGRTVAYGFDDGNALRATDLVPCAGGIRFLLHAPTGADTSPRAPAGGDREHVLSRAPLPVHLAVPGRHNVLDAMGAMAAANFLGVSWEAAAEAVSRFRGTGRRLELVGQGGGVRVFDDYAHHPTEIRATLHALRESIQPDRLIALFQPHLYSRTQQLLDEFAAAFEEADLALFMEIYGAREEPIGGVSGLLLAERAEDLRPDATTEFVGSHAAAARRVLSLVAPGDVVVCLGAGDITQTAREIGARIGGIQGDRPSTTPDPSLSRKGQPSPTPNPSLSRKGRGRGTIPDGFGMGLPSPLAGEGSGVKGDLREGSGVRVDPPPGYRGKLTRDEPLGRYTTFRIGGPAEWYAEPEDREDLLRMVAWARDQELPVIVLGGGSNLLIADEGLRGLVVRLNRLRALRFEGNDAIAEAGLPLVSLLKRVADRGLAGLEGVVGVPGAVGGALVMNAGTPHGEFGDCVVEAEVLRPDAGLVVVPREDLGLGYRRSGLKARGETLVAVRLRLRPEGPGAVRSRMEALDVHRHETQPLTIPSAGCIWKNPKPHTAGRLIDEAGCKGVREGPAEVSPVHANFIVNHGGARAADVLRLMERVRERVQSQFGIRLEPEVQLLGAIDWES